MQLNGAFVLLKNLFKLKQGLHLKSISELWFLSLVMGNRTTGFESYPIKLRLSTYPASNLFLLLLLLSSLQALLSQKYRDPILMIVDFIIKVCWCILFWLDLKMMNSMNSVNEEGYWMVLMMGKDLSGLWVLWSVYLEFNPAGSVSPLDEIRLYKSLWRNGVFHATHEKNERFKHLLAKQLRFQSRF